jgi:phosphoglycolate phosphatase
MTMTAPTTPNGYRLLVFDWDGTLMDSISTIVGCMAATVAELGLPTLREDAIRGTIGLGLREAVDELYPDGGDALFRQIVDSYRRRWLGGFADGQTLFAGARETLERLAEEGYWLTVATGKGRMGLDYDLRRTGIGGMFLTTRTTSESPPKPSPAMVHEILDELGVAAHEALVIGDTTHDLDMASAAGTSAVGVTSGSSTEEQLATREPLAILPKVSDLPGWLRRRVT